eukprot:gene38574-25852_t
MKVWEEARGEKAGHETPQLYSVHRAALAELLAAATLSRLGRSQYK